MFDSGSRYHLTAGWLLLCRYSAANRLVIVGVLRLQVGDGGVRRATIALQIGLQIGNPRLLAGRSGCFRW